MNPNSAIICQSCGMPLQHAGDHGTNADGSRNNEYCKYCYQQGKFLDEGISLEGKIETNIAIAVKMGMDQSVAEKLARETLPHLKRWNH